MRTFIVALLMAVLFSGAAAATAMAGGYSSGVSGIAAPGARIDLPVSAAWEAGVENRGVDEIAHRFSPKRYRDWKYDRRGNWKRYGGRSGKPFYRDRYYERRYGHPGYNRDYGRYSGKYPSRPRIRIWVPGFWTSDGYVNGYWTFGWRDRRGFRLDLYGYD